MENLISVAEAAQELDVTESWVRKLIGRGVITAKKFGSSYVVDKASVLEYKRTRKDRGRPRKEDST